MDYIIMLEPKKKKPKTCYLEQSKTGFSGISNEKNTSYGMACFKTIASL